MSWRDLVVLLAYVLLSLAMSFPLCLHMRTHLAGHFRDTRIFYWNNWWVGKALSLGTDPNYTGYLFHPIGSSLASHNANWISSLISVPLGALLGPTAAYNHLFLLTLYGPALAMYALVRYLTGRRDAAFVAGLVFAFAPYHVSGNWDGQMNLANVQWLPLFVLFVLRTVRRRRVGDAIAAGVAYALAGLDCWFFAIFLAMWSVLYAVWTLLTERDRWGWPLVARLALAVGVAALLLAPFAIPIIRASGEGAYGYAVDYYTEDKATDLLAFLIPSTDHPLWRPLVAPIYARFAHWRPAFVGYAVLALSVYALWRRGRRAGLWALTALLSALLAMGTTFAVGGRAFPRLPTLYRALLGLVPALRVVGQASRFNVMVALGLAVLVGMACADLLARLSQRGPRQAAVATVLLASWVCLEFLAFPLQLSEHDIPAYYTALAQEPGDFAILEMPLDHRTARDTMYPQTVHGKRLLNGHLARISPEWYAFLEANMALKSMRIQMPLDPTLHDVPRELALIAANGARYALIHKQSLAIGPQVGPEVLAYWQTLLGPDPVYEDDALVVYALPASAALEGPPTLRFAGALSALDVRVRRAWLRPQGEEVLSLDLAWRAEAQIDRPYDLTLILRAPGGAVVAQQQDVRIVPLCPTERWQAGMVLGERYLLPIPSDLSPGTYALSLHVTDAASGDSVGADEVTFVLPGRAEPLVPALDAIAQPASVVYGERLAFLGYTATAGDGQLALDLAWLAVDEMPALKVFVHLLAEDGSIVAQHDGMPRDWSYPTTLWARGEVFVDHVVLDTSGVGPGTYRLAVGVYEPEGDRYVAVSRDGSPVFDGRATLSQPIELAEEASGGHGSR